MARLLTHHLKTALLLAILLGCSASLIGVALSRHMLSVYDIPLSTSGLVVCVIAILFLLIRTVISIVNNSCCGDHRIRREKENQDTEKKEAY
jgi:ABC-type Mn2+/Zn2+ transport system permease subunit